MVTSFCAALAVLRIVALAFGSAGIANIRANAAEFAGELGTSTHQGRRGPTDFSAIAIQPNTVGHFVHVGFAQTRASAMLALLRTFNTGCDTSLVLFVRHRTALLKE